VSVLNPHSLRAAYEFLCETPPFCRWNLPDGDDVVFRVGRDPALRGWYVVERGKHLIAISRNTISHTNNLLATMAHEMVHLHLREHRLDRCGEHGKAFTRAAELVCRYHGWDPKLF
jgi:hypothetical protein